MFWIQVLYWIYGLQRFSPSLCALQCLSQNRIFNFSKLPTEEPARPESTEL